MFKCFSAQNPALGTDIDEANNVTDSMSVCFCVCVCVHMCATDRNGLGPSKEGEAQYSVVHCTGYIKAWPPAGKQTCTYTYPQLYALVSTPAKPKLHLPA